jgi:hypothetical protein
MIPKILDFPIAPNVRMLRACVNPEGCNKRVSNLQIIGGQMYEVCLCPAWGASKYGKKVIYACGYEQRQQVPGEQP